MKIRDKLKGWFYPYSQCSIRSFFIDVKRVILLKNVRGYFILANKKACEYCQYFTRLVKRY